MTRPLFDLGPRLALCASLVRRGGRLADIGTDHAYLPIWLLKTGAVPGAIAADINPGPLDAARSHGEKYGVGPELQYRLSDGLREISPEEADDIVIAGMGGELILRMVEETPWLKDGKKRLVLQPMSSVPELRLGLKRLGFEVLEERAARDGGKVYSAFSVRYIGKEPGTGRFYPWLGKLRPGDPAVKEYGEKVLRELSNQEMGAAHRGDIRRLEELRALEASIAARYLCRKP